MCLRQLWIASFRDSPPYLMSTFSISLRILKRCFLPVSGKRMRLMMGCPPEGPMPISPRSIGGSIWSTIQRASSSPRGTSPRW